MKLSFNEKQRSMLFGIGIVALIIILTVFDLSDIKLDGDSTVSRLIKDTVMRLACGICLIFFIGSFGLRILNPIAPPLKKSLLIALPCLIISVNNLPAIALATGTAHVTGSAYAVMVFTVNCLSIGLFEEAAFRGIILPFIVKKYPKTTKGVFTSIIVSSAVFGLVHIINLFSGSGIGAVILQTGYSFLLGIMWSAVLLKTRNLWICVMLHAVYDFCGLLVTELGTGIWWDTPTIIITVLLSIAAAYYVLRLILSIKPEDIESVYGKKN